MIGSFEIDNLGATKNHKVVRPLAVTTRGQLEIVIGRFPFPQSQSDLEQTVLLKARGPAGDLTHNANFHHLKAGPSVFATALQSGASLQEVQTLADRLSHQGVLATSPYAYLAVKTFVHYLGSQRLNSTKYLTVLEPNRRWPHERYDFDFQITCIQVGMQLEAPAFVQGLVHEVTRQAYFTVLNIAQFHRACEVNGHLNWFLLNWASALDSPKNWMCDSKLASLKQGLRAVASLRDLFATYIQAHPIYAQKNPTVAKLVHDAVDLANAEKAQAAAAAKALEDAGAAAVADVTNPTAAGKRKVEDLEEEGVAGAAEGESGKKAGKKTKRAKKPKKSA